MLDHQDADAARRDLADALGELRLLPRAEAGGGLVEDDEPGIERERARELEAPGEARRQRGAGPQRLTRKADASQQFQRLCLEVSAPIAGIGAPQACEKANSAGSRGARERYCSLKEGQRVGLGWQSNSCGECEWCTRGMENLCPFSEATCVHRHGGYANRVRANVRFVFPIPEALESENAAPLLCGGITVYSPLRSHGVNPSSRVGVIGIGGLGHLAVQFARVFGAEVTSFSTSAAKEPEARAMGAHNFVNTRETRALK